MAERILMPKQGNTVESCVILEWKKKVGDQVAVGDILCEVETDKATFEVASEHEGIVLKVLHEEGDDVPVLQTIAWIGTEGEDVPEAMAEESVDAQPAVTKEELAPAAQIEKRETGEHAGEAGFIRISPRARNLASAKNIPLDNITGSGPGERIIERDIRGVLSEKAPVSPAAVNRAGTGDLAIPARGSGAGGRVVASDLRKVSSAADFPGETTKLEVKGFRKVIAQRMHASLAETAQLTLHSSADARNILAYREKLKTSDPDQGLSGISLGDMVMYAVSRVLTRFPDINAHFLGDKIVSFKHAHLGLAVDTPKGLLVPTVRFADGLSLKALSEESKRLAETARLGKAGTEELVNGSFTVTNLGSLGIESFTPVLNPPQVAILGVCAIRREAVEENGEVCFIPRIGLSLTIDHQAVDGAPAARFLKDLGDALAQFEILLSV